MDDLLSMFEGLNCADRSDLTANFCRILQCDKKVAEFFLDSVRPLRPRPHTNAALLFFFFFRPVRSPFSTLIIIVIITLPLFHHVI